MIKLYRTFVFFFKWKVGLKVASNMVHNDPILFPQLMLMTFSRDFVLAAYLKGYSYRDSIKLLFEDQEKRIKRKMYKDKKRKAMLEAMTDDEIDVYADRVAQTREYHEFDDARSQFD